MFSASGKLLLKINHLCFGTALYCMITEKRKQVFILKIKCNKKELRIVFQKNQNQTLNVLKLKIMKFQSNNLLENLTRQEFKILTTEVKETLDTDFKKEKKRIFSAAQYWDMQRRKKNLFNTRSYF